MTYCVTTQYGTVIVRGTLRRCHAYAMAQPHPGNYTVRPVNTIPTL